jgi:hypothetical protein
MAGDGADRPHQRFVAALQGVAGMQGAGVGRAGGLRSESPVKLDLQAEKPFQRRHGGVL